MDLEIVNEPKNYVKNGSYTLFFITGGRTRGTFYIGNGRKSTTLGFKTESAARDYFRRHLNIANEKAREA